jgi:hypothetical protein
MKDEQVCFPDSQDPNRAVVKSLKPDGKEYNVRNIYSNFPTCNCKWADQGNMCKHQLKALLVKGVLGGVLAQQLGSRFGGQGGGIEHLGQAHTHGEQPVITTHQPRTESDGQMPTDEVQSALFLFGSL